MSILFEFIFKYILKVYDFIRINLLNKGTHIEYASIASDFSDDKQYGKAIEFYSKAILKYSNYSTYFNNRAYCKSKLNNFLGSISDYSMAIEIEPNNALYYTNRGITLLENGKKDKALSDFQKASELGSDEAKTLLNKYSPKSDKSSFDLEHDLLKPKQSKIKYASGRKYKLYIDYTGVGYVSDFNCYFSEEKNEYLSKHLNDSDMSIVFKTEDDIKKSNFIAQKISSLKSLKKCKFQLKNLISENDLILDVFYKKINFSGKTKYVIKLINYKSSILFVPYYETQYMPFEYELKDPYSGEVLEKVLIDEIPVDEIYIDDLPIPVKITTNDFIIIGEEEFLKRRTSYKKTTNVDIDELILPDNFEISVELKNAYDKIEKTNNNYFVTGKAGTSKSTLLKYFLKNTSKSVAVVAPTGISAINVGGQTIHSFFKLPPQIIDIKKFKPNISEIYGKIDTLVIDEISMVKSDIIDSIDLTLKKNNNPNAVFGGIQIIMFGDLLQLPPVVENNPHVRMFYSDNYKSEWFFHGNSISENLPDIIHLEKVYRQDDSKFIDFLNKIRTGQIKSSDLDLINKRCLHINSDNIYLTTTNATSNRINQELLNSIKQKSFVFKGELEGQFLLKELPVDIELTLKVGAQVMFVKNDKDHRWVNGTLGKVDNLTSDKITVRIKNNVFEVEKAIWQNIEYEYDPKTKTIKQNVIGTYTQFPLKLAWAITIHKSQGKTFNQIIVDLGTGAFAPGQVYVALSRCTSIDGIYLERPIQLSDIIVDHRAVSFLEKQGVELLN